MATKYRTFNRRRYAALSYLSWLLPVTPATIKYRLDGERHYYVRNDGGIVYFAREFITIIAPKRLAGRRFVRIVQRP